MIRSLIMALGVGFLLSLATPVQVFSAASEPQPVARLSVRSSTDQAIDVELTITGFAAIPNATQAQTAQPLIIAGTEQALIPGVPQVPTLGTLLGIPTPQGVTVTVVTSETAEFTGYQLPLTPALASNADESATTAPATNTGAPLADAFFPAAPVVLGDVGYLRDQAVAQVQFYPVQYNPVRHLLRLYRRLVVRITWDSANPIAASTFMEISPPYNQLLRQRLLNAPALAGPADSRCPTALYAAEMAVTGAITPALKIGIQATGIYKLSADDLRNAGLDPATLDPRTLHLTSHNREIPLLVVGEADGRLDPGDYLLFYATAWHDRYTATNLYWLSAGRANGLRMDQRMVESPSSEAPTLHFATTIHAEEDSVYWQAMPGHGEDRWFWGRRLSPNTQGIEVSRPYTVVVNQVAAASDVTVRVRLKGYTSLAHRTQLSVNGHLVDDQTWRGQEQFTHSAIFSATMLQEGANRVTVTTVDQGVVPDQVLLNWIEVDYAQRYVSRGDQLWFGTPAAGTTAFAIRGFTNPKLELFDVTNSDRPVHLRNAQVTETENDYTLRYQEPGQADKRYLALTAAQMRSPAFLQLDQPSTWRSTSNGADYIIITHADFHAAAQRLAAQRRAAGLRVAVVNVDDLYDEFNAGLFNPRAVRDFLAYAYTDWQPPAPTYVVLLGDANQDYLDNLHDGTPNYVPSQVIESELFGEVSSDAWFAAVHGADPLPDLLIGRLSARSAQEAETIVDKLIHYDSPNLARTWNDRVLLVTDDDEPAFRTLSEQLAGQLPASYPIQRLDAATYPPGDLTADLVKALNQGRSLVNYTGHGEYFGWGAWDAERKPIFTVETVAQLHNREQLPVITTANCLNGFFAGPAEQPALAEVLQRQPTGGAVAVWAPTSLEYTQGHAILLDKFYQALFTEGQRTLGAATTSAALATYAQNNFWRELIQTYVLFGDPATQIRMPVNPFQIQIYLSAIAK